MSDATVDNDSVKATQGTCMYPLTTFIDFILIGISDSYLLLNTHLSGTGFLYLSFATLLFVIIHAFLDIIFFTSKIADIFQKIPFGLVIAHLRVPGSPSSVEIDILHVHWILSSLCSTIVITLVSPVTL